MAKKTAIAKPARAATKRVTIRRRAHEYDHQYGLSLDGRTTTPAIKVAKASKKV